ncbi:MAG: GNAT family N-acetyltransferase [Candidatus Eremiobacteraeota bacterium]|nr:GNAT family N-acetyltransferase [Candidatus Eremiobacteraeota bacterium]MBC5827821.1 GNAT family N-acetyltransferase [Candidatus Eremiobacteraeota bacterium]
MTVTVRTARTAPEFEQFRELAIEYEESLDPQLRHADFASELVALHEHYAAPNAAFVAAVDEKPAGCVALCELDGSTGLVKKMYVRPNCRNLGVARSLMTTLIDHARRQFYAELVLDTDRQRLSAAYALYHSIGFEECEPYGSVAYACPTFMRLRL